MDYRGKEVWILQIQILDSQKIQIHVNYFILILKSTKFEKDNNDLVFFFFLGFSTVSDSQGITEFSSHLGFSEDSNSQNSEPTPKRLKTD